ncbi:rcc01693 family protein [Phaeovulum sp.]|uniref:rcc01693 family protein n=1 Tax=Phaeovulum sp. TaxID=2934796 RepID=UPI0039E4536A
MSGAGGFDWPGLLRVGLRGLGLSPGAFWRLTPAELALMLGDGGGAAPLTRARLDELAAKWPDQVNGAPVDRAGR